MTRWTRSWTATAPLLALLSAPLWAGCEADDEDGDDALVTPYVAPEGDCDPLDESLCALPFPSNRYLVPDADRATGYTLTFEATSLPTNIFGVSIDPAPYTRRDGYGVHSPLLVKFPNVDVSGMATEWDPSPSLAEDAPLVWLAVSANGTTSRVPYFVDIDVAEPDPAERVLIVRPAVLLREGTRYVVGFRNLRDTDGRTIPPSHAFAALRARQTTNNPQLAPRQARFNEIFDILEGEGVDIDRLTLAWDFVTASSESLHGWMLDVRDQALAAVEADGGVQFTLDEVTRFSTDESPDIAVELVGTFKVPHFMDEVVAEDGKVTYAMHLGEDGRPAQNGWAEAPVWIRIPHSAVDGPAHDLLLYGHGQNGSGSQVRGGFNSRIANTHHGIFAATDMWGMSELDVGGIVSMLEDFSGMPRLADRLHQGIVNHVLLARAMKTTFLDQPIIEELGITVNTSEVYYSGISQGGIYGPTVIAVSPDIRRGHLGVPGNHYAFLLFRSANFGEFFDLISAYYQDRPSQLLLIHTIQQLWDGTDSVSYYRHLHNPLPGSPPNSVLLAPAKGDIQVAVSANEWLVRSGIGIGLMDKYDDERTVWGVAPTRYPHTGSGVVLYDFGNPWADPGVNAPPTSDTEDPHGKPRQEAHHNEQMMHFLRTGEIIDVCGGNGCNPD